MTTNILRTRDSWWIELAGAATRIHTGATTTSALLADRPAIAAAAAGDGATVAVDSLSLLSPVTAPCRVIAQMINYRSHAKDSGFNPDTVLPTFFRKASGSITGPHSDIVRPPHVRLLDYEVELGLVVGADLPVGTTVTEDSLPDYVAGVVVANDISARDVQLVKGQFYESKSYPTFTPVGPHLVLLDAADFAALPALRLQLCINGITRQDAPLTDMICPPANALSVVSGFQRLCAGDLLLTGTPGGTALKAPPKVVEIIGGLLPTELKWKVFLGRQESNPAYLQSGDVITSRIATADGRLNLGTQRTIVRGAQPAR